MRSKENILRHELIGLTVEVLESRDKNKEGLKGTVSDETKNMLAIQTKNGEKQVPKRGCKFRFSIKEEKIDVEGRKLESKPEERIKNH